MRPFRSQPAVRRAAAVLGTAAALAVGGCSSDQPTATVTPGASVSAPNVSSSATVPAATATPALPKITGGPVLAAKIDNTSASRPRAGVGTADVVYVEPVEAGLTRLLAVWTTSMPPQIGPVRSGRETDVDLLANWGKVAFAFSGGSAYTVSVLKTGQQVNLSFDESQEGFHRDRSRRAPYNVMGDTTALLARAGGSVPPQDPGFRFGAALTGGTAGSTVATAWQNSKISLAWDAARKQYLVTTDDRPDMDADGTQHGASTVVVQVVPTHLSQNRDVNGVQSPVAEVIGTGPATVLRSGLAWAGQWSRANAAAPTDFTSGGKTVPMASGPIWVLLVPQGQAVTVG